MGEMDEAGDCAWLIWCSCCCSSGVVLFIKCDDELPDDGEDCCEPLPPVRRSIRADDELRLLCGPPSPLCEVVGDVASSAFRPGMENAMLVDEAFEAFESLPGDGAVIESRRRICDCVCCWLSRLLVAAALSIIC